MCATYLTSLGEGVPMRKSWTRGLLLIGAVAATGLFLRSPLVGAAYNNFGMLALLRGTSAFENVLVNVSSAESSFQSGLATSPNSARLLRNLLIVRARKDKWFQWLERMPESDLARLELNFLDGEAEKYLVKGVIAERKRHWSKAVRAYQLALAVGVCCDPLEGAISSIEKRLAHSAAYQQNAHSEIPLPAYRIARQLGDWVLSGLDVDEFAFSIGLPFRADVFWTPLDKTCAAMLRSDWHWINDYWVEAVELTNLLPIGAFVADEEFDTLKWFLPVYNAQPSDAWTVKSINGRYALELYADQPNRSAVGVHTRVFRVRPGGVYLLAGEIYAPSGFAWLGYAWITPDGTTATHYVAQQVRTPPDTSEFYSGFLQAPEDMASVRLELLNTGPGLVRFTMLMLLPIRAPQVCSSGS